jgi:hypothetical protein
LRASQQARAFPARPVRRRRPTLTFEPPSSRAAPGNRSALGATEPNSHDSPSRKLTCDRQPTDPETGVAPGMTQGRNMRSRYRCSMCPAIHINSRSCLRSSSTHEPSDPPLRVIFSFSFLVTHRQQFEKNKPKTRSGRSPGRHLERGAPRQWVNPRTAGESGDRAHPSRDGAPLRAIL